MSLFDFIRDLRTGEPDVARASRAMKFLGWVCIVAALWNCFIPFLMPVGNNPLAVPPDYPVLALAAFLVPGALFFFAGRAIAAGESRGKRLGQSAVIILLAAFTGLLGMLFSAMHVPSSAVPRPVLVLLSIFFIGQFVVPAWFGIRYLGRLPLQEDGPVRSARQRNSGEYRDRTGAMRSSASGHERYRDAPVPFGILGTLFVLIAIPIVVTMITFRSLGPEAAAALFLPLFIMIFAGPGLYNRVVSPFEQKRSLIAAYTGGGSVYLMNGSWPFFRLLIYADGVELRVLFHRFFIPYDRLEELPEKLGFFSRGILLRSNLPGVPSSIRFYGFGTKDILARIRDHRSRFLAQRATGRDRHEPGTS